MILNFNLDKAKNHLIKIFKNKHIILHNLILKYLILNHMKIMIVLWFMINAIFKEIDWIYVENILTFLNILMDLKFFHLSFQIIYKSDFFNQQILKVSIFLKTFR